MKLSLRFLYVLPVLGIIVTDRAFTEFAFANEGSPLLGQFTLVLLASSLGFSVLYFRYMQPLMRRWFLLVMAVLACLIADSGWYLAGGRYGGRVLRLICRLSLTPDSCVSQTESVFDRWGARSLIVAKFVPGFTICTQ